VKPGDLVRVVALSPNIPNNPNSKLVFECCVGGIFSIVDITADGLVELDLGDILGESADAEHIASHTIWIEPECLEIVQARSAP
jgi:hypothetical protein